MALFSLPSSIAVSVVLLSTIVLAIGKFFLAFRKNKGKFKGLPAPPSHPIMGHLMLMNEVRQEAPSDLHPHCLPLLIKEKYNMGDVFYLNLWPFAPDFLVITDPEAAQSLLNSAKYWTLMAWMEHLTGLDSLIVQHGQEWKTWRSIFNSGFSVNYLLTLTNQILEDVDVFYDILCEHANSNTPLRLEEAATRLTVDVIARVTLDINVNSQRTESEFLNAMKRQINLLAYQADPNPLAKFNPLLYPRLWKNDRIMKKYVSRVLRERFEIRRQEDGNLKRKHIIDLALDAYSAEEQKGVQVKDQTIDPAFERIATSQLRTFFFAGHDTTSSTICYALHLLEKNPEILQKVMDEHDRVFGKDPAEAGNVLRKSPASINQLDYTLAVIKEVLRLFPPASALRDESTPTYDPKTGETYPTAGFQVWILHVGMHRNPKLFPDPHKFRPERFLQPELAAQTPNAFRPFEKGPRNCIGQELALLEIKIVMALVVRRLKVVGAYDSLSQLPKEKDGMEWSSYATTAEETRQLWGEEAYQTLRGTAKPRQGLPVRVSFR